MFENVVLTRIFGPKRDEVTGEWRKLHNEELNDLYPSHNIVRVINSRRMRLALRVARMEMGKAHIRFWWGKMRVRGHWGDPAVDEDNFNMDFHEVGYGGVVWMELASGRYRW